MQTTCACDLLFDLGRWVLLGGLAGRAEAGQKQAVAAEAVSCRRLDLCRRLVDQASGHLSHLAAPLALHVLVVGGRELVARLAVAEIDPLGDPLVCQPQQRTEHRRVVGRDTRTVQLHLHLVYRPSVTWRVRQSILNGIANGAGSRHRAKIPNKNAPAQSPLRLKVRVARHAAGAEGLTARATCRLARP